MPASCGRRLRCEQRRSHPRRSISEHLGWKTPWLISSTGPTRGGCPVGPPLPCYRAMRARSAAMNSLQTG